MKFGFMTNDWFKNPVYQDTLDYIHSVNCHYLFNEIPLKWLGLPHEPISSKNL